MRCESPEAGVMRGRMSPRTEGGESCGRETQAAMNDFLEIPSVLWSLWSRTSFAGQGASSLQGPHVRAE